MCVRRALPAVALLALSAPLAAAVRVMGTSAWGSQRASGREALSANPIRKVVTLLQNMAKKVDAEGEAEKELYEKFGCYCKTGTMDLTQSISDSSAKVPALQSDIEESKSTSVRLKEDLKQHQVDRDSAKTAMQEATSLREKENAAYVKESTELKGYVSSLASAIPAIESGMSGGAGLLQLGAKTAVALRRAAAADMELTDDDRQSVISFLSGTAAGSAAEAEGYVPKGGEIVGILKDMKDTFDKDLKAVDEKESEAAKLYEDLMAAKQKEVKTLGESIEKKTGRVGDLEVQIVHMKNDLSSTEAALVEDQKFMKDLESDCDGKKAEYEERVKTRSEELLAIHDTIKILNDDNALELFKKTLPSASFLQTGKGDDVRRQRALSALRRAGEAAGHGVRGGPGSTASVGVRFLTLALSGQKVDFSKVIKMIEDMISLLAEEQAGDEHKKDYCSKQIDAAEDKAKELARDASDLETSIEERKAEVAQLADEIKALNSGLTELDRSVSDATIQRKKENEEFTELISSDTAAKELLRFAKSRLNKFYAPQAAGPAAPGGAAVLLERADRAVSSRRSRQAPPPGTWGAYQKKSQESGSAVAMIDLLVRDLEKEMIEAEKQEELAQKAYEELMSDSAAKRAKDSKSIRVKESSKADSEDLIAKEQGDLSSTKKEFMATERYSKQLHADCDWLLQNFELRRTARSEETESLKNAKAVLAGADFSLVQSGALLRRRRLQ